MLGQPLPRGVILTNSVLVNESPSTSPFRQMHLPILQPDSFYVTGSGGLGYGMPASVGVALGQPSRKVIALIGDGSAMYSIQALYTAAQLGLPVTFVIANNRRYEALQSFASHFDLPRNIVGTELSNLDFVALAKGHGCDAVRVSDGRELDAALNRAMSATTPFLLQVDLS